MQSISIIHSFPLTHSLILIRHTAICYVSRGKVLCFKIGFENLNRFVFQSKFIFNHHTALYFFQKKISFMSATFCCITTSVFLLTKRRMAKLVDA